MSDLSDYENAKMSRDADVTGSSSSILSSSSGSDATGGTTFPAAHTPNNLSELNGADQAQPAPVVDLTDGGDKASEKTASPTSASRREGSESSGSTPPAGEPVQARHRARSRSLRVNGILVFRMADRDMMDRAGDRPLYSVDYFTSAVTTFYLVSLREEFAIPNNVELVVPGPNDLLPRPPLGYITLSTEFFRAGLHPPFHPYLRQTLTSLNVAPMQLNTNAFRILIICFILWVPITFSRGYVWTRGPHVDASCMEKNNLLREKADPERNQNRLFSHLSLEKYRWFGSSSTSGCPDDLLRVAQPGEATITSRIPEPVLHYRAQTVVTAEVATTSDPSEVPQGVPVAPSHGQRSVSSSPGTWGPRVADENMDLVLRQLFPARDLRIEESTIAEWEQRGSKRPSEQDRMARLQKVARTGDGVKSRVGDSSAAPSSRAGPSATATKVTSDPPEARAIVSKFDNKLTSEVAKSSRRSDPIVAIGDCAEKLIEALYLAFSGSSTTQGYANRMEADVASIKAEDAQRKAENDLAAAQSEHSRYLQVARPTALDEARR
ncbi:hypothetical protein TIFTF001_018835 [Ficus carica]|uniref:Uncharacterized protein n=1 Tax=Ficus carica TaxID=3494 RepID=A0AA88DC26_FICCA|nr:hypothetical protein TIFTF001_018835 [Ficus carica]